MDRIRQWRKKRKAPHNPPQETSRDPTLPNPPAHPDTDSGPPESPPIPSFPDGVKVLHDCPDATVDICFVHGLTGDRESTWTANGQSRPWPKTLLPKKLNKARILTYGYDAYIVGNSVASSNRLIDHATNFLHDLTTDRVCCNASSRPLIFVAHSLGGLVCKGAILLSRNNPEPHLRHIFNCTKGIVFMGTPHKGSWMADWAKIPASAIGLVKSTNKSLLDILETNNQALELIQVNFWSTIRERQKAGQPPEVTCFFEELPLPGFGTVVSKESATLEGYSLISIHANHRDMVKFPSAEENGFKRLLGELVRWESQTRHPHASQTEELSPSEGNRGSSSVNHGPITRTIITGERVQGIHTGNGSQHNYLVPNLPEPSKPLEDCQKSLAFDTMNDRYNDLYRYPVVTGTCEWLLRHDTYKSWAACDRGLLWIKGKPGSGKSTLLKYALNNHKVRDSALVLSFFFHGRGDELQTTPLGLFRSLLHQVLAQAPDTLSDLVDTFKKRCKDMGKPPEKWQWHPEELWRFFESSLPRVLKSHSILVLVDALDECGQDNAKDLVQKFKSLLESLQSPSASLKQFRICFACRHYPILDLDGVFEICLENENPKDIAIFVDEQLAAFRERTSSTILALITDRASGIFLWARLVVKRVLDLEREGENPEKIELEILSTPPELDELYKGLIQSMKPASLKLIQWICFATRPLLLDELRWAMVIDADCPHRSLQACLGAEDNDSERMKRQVQTVPAATFLIVCPEHAYIGENRRS